MTKKGVILSIGLTLPLLFSAGCDKASDQTPLREDMLLQIGDSALYLNDVLARIPNGLEKGDSAALFSSIVDTWISNLLLSEMAAESLPDMDKIDRLVEQYRRQLIISEYRRIIKSSGHNKVSDNDVKRYYNEHSPELILERPIIKGIYLKVPDQAAADGKLQNLMEKPEGNAVDRLDQIGIETAMQYDYFADKWVDWETIADQIPYRFFDPDAFVESTKDFTTSYNGATYILHISDFLCSGERMPYEFAVPQIREILSRTNSEEYERGIINGLYRRALKEGRLKKVTYDPITKTMIPQKK
ncbi:MAG: hypothetical protein NC201_02860 [Prevotella sp.]|nr:hypothetical protein [Bacteroides sp.]MCM1366166.1 hypothetical protein [Prevotella sp.]MCM1436769.1 hypothetical protein [Prevotella sp.]